MSKPVSTGSIMTVVPRALIKKPAMPSHHTVDSSDAPNAPASSPWVSGAIACPAGLTRDTFPGPFVTVSCIIRLQVSGPRVVPRTLGRRTAGTPPVTIRMSGDRIKPADGGDARGAFGRKVVSRLQRQPGAGGAHASLRVALRDTTAGSTTCGV